MNAIWPRCSISSPACSSSWRCAGLSNPETSRRGNLFGMIGMAIAVATTLAPHPPAGFGAWTLVVRRLRASAAAPAR